MRRLVILVVLLILFLVGWSAITKTTPNFTNFLERSTTSPLAQPDENIKIVSEESVVIDVVKRVGPSVVTIAGESSSEIVEDDPFSIFGFPSPDQEGADEPQNIGSGFIINSEGTIVTNKHVVSDPEVTYYVVTKNEKRYDVKNIYRDPSNDIAIIKIDPSQNATESLPPVKLGDSSKIQVGQLAIAIGTPLGEFNNSVTTGVISGVGRGITAGSPFEGFIEQLDNVIQTDAAINPGNSGGPLLDSSGNVITVNTAVSSNGQNIGFALPINLIKDSLSTFNETGQFNRPYLGVAYRMISRDISIQNSIPEGAYVQTVVANSAAAKAGIEEGDIITRFDNRNVRAESSELANLISNKKVGDRVQATIWREDENGTGRTQEVTIILEVAPSQ